MLLDPVCLQETLLEWLPVLEKTLGLVELESTASVRDSNTSGLVEESEILHTCSEHQEEHGLTEDLNRSKEELRGCSDHGEEEDGERELASDHKDNQTDESNGIHIEPVRVVPPKPVPADLLTNLTQLATLYTEYSCFRKQENNYTLGCITFLRRYFFLLDQERVRRMCLLCYKEQPEIHGSFIEALLGQTLFDDCT